MRYLSILVGVCLAVALVAWWLLEMLTGPDMSTAN